MPKHPPNGTAPEEPAVSRKRFKRNTMMNITLDTTNEIHFLLSNKNIHW
jgi:hypothetical protein